MPPKLSVKRKKKYEENFDVVATKHQCKICKAIVPVQSRGGTSNRKTHLEKCQTKNGNVDGEPKNIQKTMEQFATSNDLDQLIAEFLATNQQCFTVLENFAFLKIIHFKCTSNTVVPRRQDAPTLVLKEATRCQKAIVKQISPGLPLSIQFDEYCKGARRFVSVTGTQVGKRIKTFRLGVMSLGSDRATAQTIKKIVDLILTRFKIKNDVYGVTRNGRSSVKAVCRLLGLPQFSSVHCFCHLLNLAVQAGYDQIKKDLNFIMAFIASFKRSSIAVRILAENCGSTQTLKGFTRIRWNSALIALRSFISNIVPLQRFKDQEEATGFSFQIPDVSNEQKEKLQDLCDILEILETMTRLAEGRQCPCSTIVFLKKTVDNLVNETFPSYFVEKFMNGFKNKWEQVSQEYKNNVLIEMAALFDTRIIDRYLTKDEWEQIKTKVKQFGPKNNAQPHEENQQDENQQDQVQQPSSSLKQQFWAKQHVEKSSNESQSSKFERELLEYFAASKTAAIEMHPRINGHVDELLNFWEQNKGKWPQLTALARKFLSISTSSAEPERVFSDLTYLLSNDRRANLTDESVENLMLVNSYHNLRTMESKLKEDETREFFDEALDDMEVLDDFEVLNDIEVLD